MIFEYNRSDFGQFKCELQCMRCTGRLANGERCPVVTCEHLPFCAAHLREKGLEVRAVLFKRDPYYYKDEGIPGKGLFALKNFKKGDVLCDYTSATASPDRFGEILTEQEHDARYGAGDYDYGPYAVNDKVTQIYADAACSRSAASYANDSSNHNKQSDRRAFLRETPNNSFLVYDGDKFVLTAILPIKAGSEILLDYGIGYWQGVKARIPEKLLRRERRYPTYETRPGTAQDLLDIEAQSASRASAASASAASASAASAKTSRFTKRAHSATKRRKSGKSKKSPSKRRTAEM